MKSTIRIIAAVLCILLTALALGACGEGGAAASDVDIYTLCDDMKAASDFPEMLGIRTGDSREEKGFAAISDLDFDKVEAFSLYYASDGTAYELAVIKLKDASDMTALESSLKKHIENRTEQYRYYDATQVSRAESAIVAVNGSYAALIMCDGSAGLKAVFDKAFQ